MSELQIVKRNGYKLLNAMALYTRLAFLRWLEKLLRSLRQWKLWTL